MRRLRSMRRRAWSLFHRERAAREIDEEILLHIEMETEKYVAEGMNPTDARRRARLAFGAVNSVREDLRTARSFAPLESAGRDIQYALRVLSRSPVLVIVAALTLSVGVGANTAVFNLISATLLRPLPFPDDARLIAVHRTLPDGGAAPGDAVWSYPEVTRLDSVLQRGTDINPPESGGAVLAAWYADEMNVVADGSDPVRATAEIVAAEYLTVLGIEPVAGRPFARDEDARVGTHPVVIIRSGTTPWNDEAAIGATLWVNGVPLTVVGVMPASFRGLSGNADLWVTHAMAPAVYFPAYRTTEERFLRVVGRLGANTSLDTYRAQLTTARSLPSDSEEWQATAVGLRDSRRSPDTIRAQATLAGAAFLLLLIAVVNFSGLLLARANARSREAALRVALGASRGRVVRGMLLESGIIGLAGGILGIGIAVFASDPLAASVDLDELARAQMDWRALTFALVLSLCCGMIAGLIPALRSSRGDIALAVGHSSRGYSTGSASLRRPTLLSGIAIVQFASALVLLLGAGVLLEGFLRLRALDPGIHADGVVTFRIAPPDTRYRGDAAADLLRNVLERVSAVPGVQSATVGRCLPGTDCSWTPLHRSDLPEDETTIVRRHYVGPQHFSTLGIPLRRGRLLAESDRAGGPRVAVINEYAARRLWPGENPLGKRVWFGSGGGFASRDSMTEIVGVVADVAYGEAGTEMQPDFYTSYQQYVLAETMVMVRARTDASALLPELRRAVAAADPGIAVHDVRTPQQIGEDAIAAERVATSALMLFAAIGLFLAATGVYGLLSWSVAQRRREIGIRLAVGASPAQVMSQVVRDGTTLAGAGLLVGALASFGFARTLDALIPGLGAPDVRTLIAVAALLMTVAVITCLLPARAAARVDPCTTLSQ